MVRSGGWTEERVARELERWFAQRCFDAWPRYADFVADGHKRLHAELVRMGGPARWAPELGVLLIDHRRGPRITDGQLTGQLRAVIVEHGLTSFPSTAWLRDHGHASLASAVRHRGGTGRWACMLQIPGPKGSHWSDERIETELRQLCAATHRWPTKAGFHRAGKHALLSAVYRGPGRDWWVHHLGLSGPG